MVLSLGLSTIGYLTSVTTKTSALLVGFYEGLLRSLGHFNHDEMIGLYCLVVLAFVPCGDGFSVDSLPRKNTRKGTLAYGYPILLMQLLVAWSYFSSALIKLRVAGMRYFSPDNLPVLGISHSLDNLHDTQFRYAFWLPSVGKYLPFFVGLILIWELLFPLAVFWRRVRWLFLAIGIVFHLSTLFFMNIFFPFQLAMYTVFFDWPKIAAWLGNTRVLRSASLWWRNFRSVPEQFPDIRINPWSEEGVLLWDGDCGFCAAAVNRLKRFVPRVFLDQHYQAVSDRLPPEVLSWANKQAHWVDSEGRVAGGSAAIVELLAASGRPLLAGLLGSALFKPWLWLGYRIVANNRGRL